ncbi:MAG: zf-HC2 domain-containing protein [Acidobacteria bacterium]|nr:zf-HC2 domain-containing protein [Acidobacteriota bacterium]
MNTEELEKKISLYVDGELTEEESAELIRHLDMSASGKQYLRQMKKLKSAFSEIKFSEKEEEKFTEYWPNISRKISGGFGWLFLAAGILINIVYALYTFACNPGIEPFEKVISFLIISGFIILLLGVGYQRFKESKTDRYKDIMK